MIAIETSRKGRFFFELYSPVTCGFSLSYGSNRTMNFGIHPVESVELLAKVIAVVFCEAIPLPSSLNEKTGTSLPLQQRRLMVFFDCSLRDIKGSGKPVRFRVILLRIDPSWGTIRVI